MVLLDDTFLFDILFSLNKFQMNSYISGHRYKVMLLKYMYEKYWQYSCPFLSNVHWEQN